MPSLPSVFVELKASVGDFKSKMADVRSELEKTTSTAQSNSDKMAQVGKIAFAGLGAAALGFGAIAVKAALDGEQAHAQLVNAVQNSGVAFESVGGKVDDMSERFAKLGYENDAVEGALARLVQGTGNVQSAMQQMGLVADFARARHIELADAATVVGKVLGGNVGALGRLGISTKDAAGNVMTAAQALEMLHTRFSGAAQADADTYAGKLRAFSAEFKNMQERIGNELLPVLASMAGAVADAFGWFDRNREVVAVLAGVIGGPLVAAITVYAARQAMAFTESIIGTIGGIARSVLGLTAAEESAAVAAGELGAAEIVATGGLAAVGAAAGLLINHFAQQASKHAETGAAAAKQAEANQYLSDSEDGLGLSTDGATASLKEQKELFDKLKGDTDAQGSEILKLISDQQGLDRATRALADSSKGDADAKRQQQRAAENLGKAQKDLTKATDDYNKLQAGLGYKISLDQNHAHHDLEQAQLNHEQAQTKLSDAVTKYGENSDEARQASLDLESATFSLTDAQDAMGHVGEAAWNEVDAAQQKMLDAKDAVKKAIDDQAESQAKLKDQTKDGAANTLAWQQAQNQLNSDWKTFEQTIASHPEMRAQLVTQLQQMKANLPKGADTKPLEDLLTKINGLDLAKIQQASLFAMVTSGGIKFNPGDPSKILDILGGGTGTTATTAAPRPIMPYDPVTSGNLFGFRASGGPVLPGGTYVVGEDGPELLRMGSSAAGTVIPNGAGVGGVTINIYGNGRDDQTLALAVRDELLKVSRNNTTIGLG